MPKRWESSHQIIRDDNDEVARGAKAYFYAAGTTTAISVYANANLSTALTNPVIADNNGRFPAIYIPFDDVGYDERVITSGGTQLWYDFNIPNPDPVEASTDTVLDEEKVQTGHVHWEPIQGTKTGYTRCNGRTIGDASSGATERANSDTVDQFTYLWNNLANAQAAVSGGRGASAAADYAAHKTIKLPDMRNSMPAGLEDMGNTASGGFAGISFNHGNGTTPGSFVGTNTITLTEAQLPAITPAGSISNTTSTGSISVTGIINGDGVNMSVAITDPGHTHSYQSGTVSGQQNGATANDLIKSPASQTTGSSTTGITAGINANTISAHLSWSASAQTFTGNAHNHTFTGTSFGSGSAHSNLPSSYLGTWFMKLALPLFFACHTAMGMCFA